MRHTRDRGCGGTHFDLCGCMKFLLPFPFSSPPPLSLPLDAVSLFPRCLPLPLFISPFAAPFLLCVCTSLYTRSFCNASLGCVCVWCGEDVRRGGTVKGVSFSTFIEPLQCAHLISENIVSTTSRIWNHFFFFFFAFKSPGETKDVTCVLGDGGGTGDHHPSIHLWTFFP